MDGPKVFFDISIGGKEGIISIDMWCVVGQIKMQLYSVWVLIENYY